MTTNVRLAAEKFQQYLPLLKEQYPQERDNKEELKEQVNIHQKMMIHSNVVVAL